MSSSNCCFLTCIQVSQEAGQAVWYSHLFQNFPQFVMIHTVKGFGIVNKAEIDVFLELSYFFDDPVDVGNLISGSSPFSKTSLNIWKFTVHILLKSGLENFKPYFTSMWDECNCAVVWVLSLLAWNIHVNCTPTAIFDYEKTLKMAVFMKMVEQKERRSSVSTDHGTTMPVLNCLSLYFFLFKLLLFAIIDVCNQTQLWLLQLLKGIPSDTFWKKLS